MTKDPSGVIDVTIRQLKDPVGLQARLRADGVPFNVSFSGPNPACVPYYPDYRYIPTLPIHHLGKPSDFYPWIHSYDNGSVTVSDTSPADLTLVVRPVRMPLGTGFQIVALRGSVVAWGLVKTSPACTGLCRSPRGSSCISDDLCAAHRPIGIAMSPVDGRCAWPVAHGRRPRMPSAFWRWRPRAR